MSVIVAIIDGLRKDVDTGLGGANEGHIEGFIDDMIEGVVGGVRDLTNGQLLVTENSPAAMNVLVANGVVYVPNSTYDANVITKTKFWRVTVKDETAKTIGANSSGSTRIDLICVKVDKTIEPNEYASNVATVIVVAGTPGAGVPATPADHYKLAEVTVANGASSIVTANIADRRVQLQLKDEFTSYYYAADAGGDDTYVGTIEGISSYAQILGKMIVLKVATANTGPATLNINGLGAVAIKNGGTTDIATGDILANKTYILSHDGTNFQLMNPSSSAGGGTWGSITGTLSSQTDLQAALDAKAEAWKTVPGTPTRVSDTQFTITDTANANLYNLLFKKGVILKWDESGTFQTAMVISSSYASNVVTINLVGDSLTAGFTLMKYYMDMIMVKDFIIPGNLAALTDMARTWFVEMGVYILSADLNVKTAGTGSGANTLDINVSGSTKFTTKPTLAASATSDLDNVADSPSTEVAAEAPVTIDVDAVTATTPAAEAYIRLYYYPTSWRYRT